jgi:hypothetical protein
MVPARRWGNATGWSRLAVHGLAAIGLVFQWGTFSACAESGPPPQEPDYAMACRWWPELENIWTPLGWKDHCVRFNVLYNGMIVVDRPRMQRNFTRRLRQVIGSGIQLEFRPSLTAVLPAPPADAAPYTLASRDGGHGRQGWNEDAAPVLWTHWEQQGLTLRQEVFAHLAGGREVQTGVEPLFAWIRLSVVGGSATPPVERLFWQVRITRPHLARAMDRFINLKVEPEQAAYPGKLNLKRTGDAAGGGWLVQAAAGGLMAVVPAADVHVALIDERGRGGDAWLQIQMPARPGAAADLVLAATPSEPAAFEAELALGRQQALEQTRRHWSTIPSSASQVHTPEEPVNQAIRHGLRLAQLLTVRHPDTGQHLMLTGSWQYEALWSTPGAMVVSMLLDALGYHPVAEKYLEVFREEQGNVRPPGAHYEPHPGYFATPRVVNSIDWLSDHGAILYAACNHALLTDDERFIARWTPAIVQGCEFIRDSLRRRGHGGIEGLMPPGRATDSDEISQFVWIDGWNHKALVTAVRLLERVGHPRAAEFAQLAGEYRTTFLTAFRDAALRTATWEDDAGVLHRYVPTALPGGGNPRHPFYLDTGPLFLVFAELLPAEDPLMVSALHFFREGPHRKDFDLRRSGNHPACLYHEISSCEPCYSWNLFHTHQQGDRIRYLEGMYSLLAGGMSRQTFVACETRGGISGTVCTHPLAIWAARLAVIDDQLERGKLHLLRLVPRAWCRAEQETIFAQIPTEFGPVTIRFQLADQGRVLAVHWEPQFRRPPQAVVIHAPPVEGLREIRVHGRCFAAQPGDKLRWRCNSSLETFLS